MKKVISILVSLVVILSLTSAIAESWNVCMNDYAITTYPTGGAAYTYDGELLCAWHIDDPATYTSMDYISEGWLDAIDDPLVWINPASMYYSDATNVYVPPFANDQYSSYMVPQNIADAMGLQNANSN